MNLARVLVVLVVALAAAAAESATDVPPTPTPTPTSLWAPGHQHGRFQGRVGFTVSEALRGKRERFFKWLESVGCISAPFEWRDEGVAGVAGKVT
jgi:hypothetical protein